MYSTFLAMSSQSFMILQTWEYLGNYLPDVLLVRKYGFIQGQYTQYETGMMLNIKYDILVPTGFGGGKKIEYKYFI